MRLYRGQLMTKDEFDQLEKNPNQLISINTFLSTSTCSQVANAFSGSDSIGNQSDPNLIAILLEICIDSLDDLSSFPPLADISKFSPYEDEKETLLSMGTAYCV